MTRMDRIERSEEVTDALVFFVHILSFRKRDAGKAGLKIPVWWRSETALDLCAHHDGHDKHQQIFILIHFSRDHNPGFIWR